MERLRATTATAVTSSAEAPGSEDVPDAGRRSSQPHLPLTANSMQNAVAIEIRVRNAVNSPNVNCRGNGFNANCRWFYTGNGARSPSVEPTDSQILADPIQRAFKGNSVISGSVRWLRLTTSILTATAITTRSTWTPRVCRQTAVEASTWRWDSRAVSRSMQASRRSCSSTAPGRARRRGGLRPSLYRAGHRYPAGDAPRLQPRRRLRPASLQLAGTDLSA